MPRPGRRLFLALCAALLLAAAACSTLTVRHLARAPWSVAPGQSLPMKFWRFDYDVVKLPDQYGIKGHALPTAEVPDWVAFASDLWFEAYLCDADGRVLARASRVYQSRPLDRASGVDFEFILKPFPPQGKDAKLFVTFGYSMNAADRAPQSGDSAAPPRVFFASESALSRF
ncbi:MAG: hypothetical protein AB1916_06790 [Thermodesulfobacteriota bacterium]